MDLINRVTYDYADLDEAFPPCDPGMLPAGSRILVQMRSPKKKTKGGILLPEGGDTQSTEFWAQQTAKVIAVGALAFHNRNSMQPWPEGAWCEVGDYVRVPMHGGDRFTVSVMDRDGDLTEALLVIFDDTNVIAKITGDPTKIKAFI